MKFLCKDIQKLQPERTDRQIHKHTDRQTDSMKTLPSRIHGREKVSLYEFTKMFIALLISLTTMCLASSEWTKESILKTRTKHVLVSPNTLYCTTPTKDAIVQGQNLEYHG